MWNYFLCLLHECPKPPNLGSHEHDNRYDTENREANLPETSNNDGSEQEPTIYYKIYEK